MIKLTQKLALELYVSPKMRTVEMKTEGVICGSYAYYLGGGGVYDEDDVNDNGEY